MRLFTCSTTISTLVNTVFICRLTRKTSCFPWLVERVNLSSCNWEMNVSGEWDINSAQLSLCRVGMTRQSDSSIVFRRKKPVKFARALHRDSVPLTCNIKGLSSTLSCNRSYHRLPKLKIWLCICGVTIFILTIPILVNLHRKNFKNN